MIFLRDTKNLIIPEHSWNDNDNDNDKLPRVLARHGEYLVKGRTWLKPTKINKRNAQGKLYQTPNSHFQIKNI